MNRGEALFIEKLAIICVSSAASVSLLAALKKKDLRVMRKSTSILRSNVTIQRRAMSP